MIVTIIFFCALILTINLIQQIIIMTINWLSYNMRSEQERKVLGAFKDRTSDVRNIESILVPILWAIFYYLTH